MHKDEVTLSQAAEITGYSIRQLRYMVKRNRIRHARLGDKLVVLFRPDVDALKGRRWQGNPVAKEG